MIAKFVKAHPRLWKAGLLVLWIIGYCVNPALSMMEIGSSRWVTISALSCAALFLILMFMAIPANGVNEKERDDEDVFEEAPESNHSDNAVGGA